MKIIVFDGDFHEEEIAWLKDQADEESNDHWLAENDFQPLWSPMDDIGGEPTFWVKLYSHEKSSARLAEIGDWRTAECVLLPDTVSYFRFLSSPICSWIPTYEHIRALHGTADRTFFLWHGHHAPSCTGDSAIGRSCDQCDPSGSETRKATRERRRARRTREGSETP